MINVNIVSLSPRGQETIRGRSDGFKDQDVRE